MTPTVVITQISKRWQYFQYFLLGFYLLERKGLIKLKFKCGTFFNLSTKTDNHLINRVCLKAHREKSHNIYILAGYVKNDGCKKYFCIDSADSPFLFSKKKLEQVDCYFKMQCPVEINGNKGYELTDKVSIPYIDFSHTDPKIRFDGCGKHPEIDIDRYKDKIRPLMVGFRRLAFNNTYKALNSAYQNYMSSQHSKPRKKVMCYFGNSRGPEQSQHLTEYDWDSESHIMTAYKDLLEHPNVKRGKISDILNSMGEDYDGRIISEDNADSKSTKKRTDLIIPIERFCEHVSQFYYNVNVSGYRMSIPNRFIESFVVGTAILTDKLSVKWFKAFDDEVVETVKMGYYPDSDVDWKAFQECLNSLNYDSEKVASLFKQKWSPEIVAKYIIDTVLTDC